MNIMDMNVIDSNASTMGISRLTLMENAGRSIANKIVNISKPCKVTIFAGTGGNGGDGFVAARHLLNMDFEVDIYFLGHPSDIKSTESLKNWEILKNINIKTNSLEIHVIKDS